VRHTKDVDHRSDLWALGVIAFECIVGTRPFESEALGDLLIMICTEEVPTPSEHAIVPPGFDPWFAKACARRPDDRFQTAKEMVEALRVAVLGGGAESSERHATEPVAVKAERSAHSLPMGQTTSGLVRTDNGDDASSKKTTSKLVIGAAVFGALVIVVAVGAFLRGQTAQNGVEASALVESAGTVVPNAPPSSVAPVPSPEVSVAIVDAGSLVVPADAAGPSPTDAASARTGRLPKPPSTGKPTPTANSTGSPAPTSTAGRDYGF
jgi:serine/threonine-protein kinase